MPRKPRTKHAYKLGQEQPRWLPPDEALAYFREATVWEPVQSSNVAAFAWYELPEAARSLTINARSEQGVAVLGVRFWWNVYYLYPVRKGAFDTALAATGGAWEGRSPGRWVWHNLRPPLSSGPCAGPYT